MATVVTCDVCGDQILFPDLPAMKLEVPSDSDHPRTGDPIYREIDCCPRCVRMLMPLRVEHPLRVIQLMEAAKEAGE